jgi:hypothetical protein
MLTGCRVYQKTSGTIEETSEHPYWVEITFKNQETMRFQEIIFKDELFFGVLKKRGRTYEYLIKPDEIDRIRLENRALTTIWWTVIAYPGTLLLTFGAFFYLLYLAGFA